MRFQLVCSKTQSGNDNNPKKIISSFTAYTEIDLDIGKASDVDLDMDVDIDVLKQDF